MLHNNNNAFQIVLYLMANFRALNDANNQFLDIIVLQFINTKLYQIIGCSVTYAGQLQDLH